jgi:hypothetical protein
MEIFYSDIWCTVFEEDKNVRHRICTLCLFPYLLQFLNNNSAREKITELVPKNVDCIWQCYGINCYIFLIFNLSISDFFLFGEINWITCKFIAKKIESVLLVVCSSYLPAMRIVIFEDFNRIRSNKPTNWNMLLCHLL